jgi:hypothetical protein
MMKQSKNINNIIVENEDQLVEIELDDVDNSSDNDSDNDVYDKEIKTQITNKGVRSIYSEYLEKDKLLLRPEYQRELSWKIEKMNAFVDTIYRGWIVPNYVIYKLSENEKKDNKLQNLKHMYECIDGQHRLITIKMFIEGIKYPNLEREKYIYIKIGDDRVYYNMDENNLSSIKKRSGSLRNITCRNLTEEEKDKFDNFQMSIHTIEPVKNGLDMKTKCEIFNRLQNGEKVESYVKLRNLNNNPITNYIRSSRSLAILNNFNIMKKIELNKKTKPKHDESFTMYFLIRATLIVDKKNLEINYLDLNIKKYLEQNDGEGSPAVQIRNHTVSDLFSKVMIFMEWFSNLITSNKFIPELCYIFICIYANYDISEVDKLIKWLTLETNKKYLDKFNSIKTYKNSSNSNEEFLQNNKVTSAAKMKEQYIWIVQFVLKKQSILE